MYQVTWHFLMPSQIYLLDILYYDLQENKEEMVHGRDPTQPVKIHEVRGNPHPWHSREDEEKIDDPQQVWYDDEQQACGQEALIFEKEADASEEECRVRDPEEVVPERGMNAERDEQEECSNEDATDDRVRAHAAPVGT